MVVASGILLAALLDPVQLSHGSANPCLLPWSSFDALLGLGRLLGVRRRLLEAHFGQRLAILWHGFGPRRRAVLFDYESHEVEILRRRETPRAHLRHPSFDKIVERTNRTLVPFVSEQRACERRAKAAQQRRPMTPPAAATIHDAAGRRLFSGELKRSQRRGRGPLRDSGDLFSGVKAHGSKSQSHLFAVRSGHHLRENEFAARIVARLCGI